MSRSNPAPSPKPHEGTSEGKPGTQNLIAQLEALMPLLLRIQQAQTFGQLSFQLEPGNTLAYNAMLDHQAAVNLVEDITANSLRTLSTYLETHADRYAELQSCFGVVTEAAHCFAARDYGQAFGLIWQAYRAITGLRTMNPHLPPLHASAADRLQTSSMH